jgi:hypothetical protein
VEMVWEKILTAPDNSSLEITHHGEKTGHFGWAANVGQELAAGKIGTDEGPPEGLVETLSNYRIDVEGNLALADFANRLRFDFNVKFSTNHAWQEFNLRVTMRPSLWELRSQASEEAVHLRMEDETGKSERAFKFVDLQNPEFLAHEFDLPLPFIGAMGLSAGRKSTNPLSLGLVWEARNDWVTIGHTPVQAYRLKTKILDRFPIVIMVSRVGEILRVELPDEWVLVNEQFMNL